jgi:lambda repressor-like predicted transcriptional regulator
MKNKAKQMVVFTKEMVVASLLTVVFFTGALYEISPFSNFLNFGSDIKESWEKEYGTPPYPHAELSSLKVFLRKLDYDPAKSETILINRGIHYKMQQSLADIAKENGTSPQTIYNTLHLKLKKADASQAKKLSGLGRKSIKAVAEVMDMTTEELIEKLSRLGIEAKADDKFKAIVEEYDQSPSDVVKALGFRHE